MAENPYLNDLYGTPEEPQQRPLATTPADAGEPTARITVRPAGVPDRPVNPYAQDIVSEAAPPPPPATPNKVFGELKPAQPKSFTEQLASDLQDSLIQWGVDPYRARHVGQALTGIAGITPAGPAMSAADLVTHVPQGNVMGSVLDAVGALPAIGQVTRAIRGAPMVRPAFEAPLRETRRAAPQIGGFVTPIEPEMQTAARAGYRSIEQAPLEYHPNAPRDATNAIRRILPDPVYGNVFTREMAPGVFSTVDRFEHAFPGVAPPAPPTNLGFNAAITHQPPPPTPRSVSAYDFDNLRQQLNAFRQSGTAEAPAARQAIEILDAYMLHPPPGMMVQGHNLLPALRETYGAARGNYRAFKTAGALTDAIDAARIGAAGEFSGRNIGNRQRQAFQQYVKTPQGEAKLFGATPAQLDAIERVTTGDPLTNHLRGVSNIMGGGGGMVTGISSGLAATAGGLIAPLLGVPAKVGMAVGGIGNYFGGKITRGIANARTTAAADQVRADIARSSPLYRQRAAMPQNQPIVDPRSQARARISQAIMSSPDMRQWLTGKWNEQYVPYKNR